VKTSLTGVTIDAQDVETR